MSSLHLFHHILPAVFRLSLLVAFRRMLNPVFPISSRTGMLPCVGRMLHLLRYVFHLIKRNKEKPTSRGLVFPIECCKVGLSLLSPILVAAAPPCLLFNLHIFCPSTHEASSTIDENVQSPYRVAASALAISSVTPFYFFVYLPASSQ
jgi:hypothetical protein